MGPLLRSRMMTLVLRVLVSESSWSFHETQFLRLSAKVVRSFVSPIDTYKLPLSSALRTQR
jgi:hypothetical protein